MTRRASSHCGRTVALCAAAALSVLAAPAFAQQDAGAASERGGRIRFGGGVLGGDLTFRGSQFPELGRDDVRIDTAITGAPSLRFGLVYFFDRPFAVDVDATVGFAEITVPGTLDKAGAQPKLRLFPWGVRSHFVYRWRTSGSPQAFGIQAEIGTELVGYRIQENEVATQQGEEDPVSIGKALLMSTTIAGPSGGVALHLPLGAKLSLEVGGRYLAPLFIRETPQASGRPKGGFGLSGRLGAHLSISDSLGLELQVRRRTVEVEFKEQGDRGSTDRGVTGGRSADTYTEAMLDVTWAI